MIDINETAVNVAAEITKVYRGMVEHWVQDALGGAVPSLPGTLQWDAWVAYRAAVAMAEALSQAESAGG